MTATCGALVGRIKGSPDEPERVTEPCGKPARWRITGSTGAGVPICNRHESWWRKQTDLRRLVDAVVEPLS